jgi:hypothetical protein
MKNRVNFKIIVLTILFVIISIIVVSCAPVGSGFKGTGKIADVQNFLNKQTNGKVTDIELIHTIYVDEWIWDNKISFDGAVFWEGVTKPIPAHNILFFRAYSLDLESYIFLQFNDREDTKSYYTLTNYNPKWIEQEKADVKKMSARTKDILSGEGVEIFNEYYKKFIEEDDLDNIYKQPKEFFEDLFADDFYVKYENYITLQTTYQLWIIIETNIETYLYFKDFKIFQKAMAEVFDDIENYGISISLRFINGEEITFYKGMRIY